MTPLELMPCYGRATIRAWSRRTVRWTACQSMSCHPLTIWKAAPAEGSAVICFVSFVGLLGFLAMKDQMEVCPLSRETLLFALSLYPPYYWAAFAFSILLYLHAGSVFCP